MVRMQCAGDSAPFGNPRSSSRGTARPAAPILNISSFQRREAAAAGTGDVAAGASGGGEAAVASGVQGAGAAHPMEAGLGIAGMSRLETISLDAPPAVRCAAVCESFM